MAPIRILPPGIAERIAAGEVVERPFSVVKELVENSIDAGSTEIQVLLEDGGKSLIEVLDNGSGMSLEDLSLCIQRHATSKLASLDDLERISTLGFRGEALPSVAAVSDLKILSRPKDQAQTYELSAGDITERLQSGSRPQPVTFGHFLHSPHGTRIQARGLFSQVPARLKFLKAQSSEVSQVRDCLERISLAHPHVGFHLVSNERTVLRLRPQTEVQRIQSLLADGGEYPILTEELTTSRMKVRLHWVQGLSVPSSRKLVQVVNGRVVRDRTLQQGLLSPFRQVLLPGQFPALVLFLEVDPATLDVNVHPTKSEVRFLQSREIFLSLDRLGRSLIAREGAPIRLPAPLAPSAAAEFLAPAPSASLPVAALNTTAFSAFGSTSAGESSTPRTSLWKVSEPPSFFEDSTPTPSPLLDPAPPAVQNSLPLPQKRTALKTILFQTYLTFEEGNEILLIDQHAAHERIRYEALRKRIFHSSDRIFSSQNLLLPETVSFSSDQRSALEERLPLLSQMGFEAELFGESAMLFRAVPSEWGHRHLKPRLKNLIERLIAQDLGASDHSSAWDEALFEALASEACHSSVRAGDVLEPIEAETLVDQLFQCDHPWNCPHGRPTVVRVSQGKIEEWFQRS